jgi:hypothetical protein
MAGVEGEAAATCAGSPRKPVLVARVATDAPQASSVAPKRVRRGGDPTEGSPSEISLTGSPIRVRMGTPGGGRFSAQRREPQGSSAMAWRVCSSTTGSSRSPLATSREPAGHLYLE